MNGKGSCPRRKSVNQKTWDENWNSIFRSKKPSRKKKEGVEIEFSLNDEKLYGYIMRRLDVDSYEIHSNGETLVLSPKQFREIK